MTPEPYTHAEILDSLERLRNEGLRFWSDMEPERFVAPLGDAWSPADNVRHLIKSTTPVTQALGMPALALRTMFGAAKEPSVSYSELRDRYHGLLAAGGTAGRFAPSQAVPPDDPVAWQRELVARCGTAVSDLAKAAGGWKEPQLDVYRLPHPLLGKLTLREMLFFTLYHYEHHRGNVVRRLASGAVPG